MTVNQPDPCGQKARQARRNTPASQSVNNDLRPTNNRHVVPINQDRSVRLDLGHGGRRGEWREILINSLGPPMQVGAPGLLRCRRRVVQGRP